MFYFRMFAASRRNMDKARQPFMAEQRPPITAGPSGASRLALRVGGPYSNLDGWEDHMNLGEERNPPQSNIDVHSACSQTSRSSSLRSVLDGPIVQHRRRPGVPRTFAKALWLLHASADEQADGHHFNMASSPFLGRPFWVRCFFQVPVTFFDASSFYGARTGFCSMFLVLSTSYRRMEGSRDWHLGTRH